MTLYIIQLICYGVLGFTLASAGIKFNNWRFWLILVLILTIDYCSRNGA